MNAVSDRQLDGAVKTGGFGLVSLRTNFRFFVAIIFLWHFFFHHDYRVGLQVHSFFYFRFIITELMMIFKRVIRIFKNKTN